MKFIKKLLGGRRESRVRSNWAPFRFPGNIIEPGMVGVFARPGISGTWSALYMARTLQESYPGNTIHLVIQKEYAALANFLPWVPLVHVWESDPASSEPQPEPGMLLFASEPCDDLLRFVEKAKPGACVSTGEHPSVNIQVRTEEALFPQSIAAMTRILGMKYPSDWRPEPPSVLSEKASAILSPVSHKTLPYILTTEQAHGILEKKRAEIPLKAVLTNGKGSNIPPDTDHALFAAIVAGASAVATTDEDLWVHATALGIPVIALDRKGVFTGWKGEPARGDSQFLEQWASLIRRGW